MRVFRGDQADFGDAVSLDSCNAEILLEHGAIGLGQFFCDQVGFADRVATTEGLQNLQQIGAGADKGGGADGIGDAGGFFRIGRAQGKGYGADFLQGLVEHFPGRGEMVGESV